MTWRTILVLIVPIAVLGIAACAVDPANGTTSEDGLPGIVELNTEMDRMSYSMGVTYGRQFWLMGVAVDPSAFVKGYRDWKSGSSEVSQGQINSALSQLEQALGARGGKPFSFEAPYLDQGKRLSYIIGASLASQVMAQRYGFTTDPILRGCLDVFAGADDSQLLLSAEAITNFMLVIPERARLQDDALDQGVEGEIEE